VLPVNIAFLPTPSGGFECTGRFGLPVIARESPISTRSVIHHSAVKNSKKEVVCLLGRKDTVRTVHDPPSLGEVVGGSAGGGFADGTGRPPHKPLAWHWLIVVLLDHRPQLSHDDLGGLLDDVDLSGAREQLAAAIEKIDQLESDQ
jgi:hypothetical protein